MTKEREELEELVEELLRRITLQDRYNGKVLDAIAELSKSGKHTRFLEKTFPQIVGRYEGRALDRVLEDILDVNRRSESSFDFSGVTAIYNNDFVARALNEHYDLMERIVCGKWALGYEPLCSVDNIYGAREVIELYHPDKLEQVWQRLESSLIYGLGLTPPTRKDYRSVLAVFRDKEMARIVSAGDTELSSEMISLIGYCYTPSRANLTKRFLKAVTTYELPIQQAVCRLTRDGNDQVLANYLSLLENGLVKKIIEKGGMEKFNRIEAFSRAVGFDQKRINDFCRALDPYGVGKEEDYSLSTYGLVFLGAVGLVAVMIALGNMATVHFTSGKKNSPNNEIVLIDQYNLTKNDPERLSRIFSDEAKIGPLREIALDALKKGFAYDFQRPGSKHPVNYSAVFPLPMFNAKGSGKCGGVPVIAFDDTNKRVVFGYSCNTIDLRWKGECGTSWAAAGIEKHETIEGKLLRNRNWWEVRKEIGWEDWESSREKDGTFLYQETNHSGCSFNLDYTVQDRNKNGSLTGDTLEVYQTFPYGQTSLTLDPQGKMILPVSVASDGTKVVYFLQKGEPQVKMIEITTARLEWKK